MWATLSAPLDRERREGIRVLVTTRWVLAVASAFVINYRHGTTPSDFISLNLLLLVALGLNGMMQFSLLRGRTIPTWLPLAASAYDILGITATVALVDGFGNSSHLLYYPALMALSLAFPGRPSLVYGATTMALYPVIILLFHAENFDPGKSTDLKSLVLRLATMGSTVMAANIVMRIERDRRLRAVEAEGRRQKEVHALEERAREVERAAETERRRLLREVHDGISQGVYMLSLGLEGVAAQLSSNSHAGAVGTRVAALGRVAKETLLETRGLLFDLNRVMAGETALTDLVRNQAEEFRAVTGIEVTVEVRGHEARLPANVVGEVYRVMKESLANVYRHAGASTVGITLDFRPGSLEIQIADDGGGFDPAHSNRRAGNGLSTMVDRARDLGGELLVESAPGKGTRLRLHIPWRTDT